MLCGGGVSDFGLLWSDANLRDACIALVCERAERNCNVESNRMRAECLLACARSASMGYCQLWYDTNTILPLSARVHPHGVHHC